MKSKAPDPGWAPALLVLGAAALYLFRLGRVGLYDLDEAVYAEISREMGALGDWLTPHLDFIPYLEKPPLFYWINALAIGLLGPSAFSARLATALAAVAGVGLVFGIGREIWGRRAGLAAGAVLATSFGFFVFGRMAMPDMLFTVLVTAAFRGFVPALLDERPRPLAVFGGYASMAAAVLAKGLIGLVFPALALGAFLLLTRDRKLLGRLAPVRGAALFLAIAAPWHALMAAKFPGFLRFYVVNEHVLRFLGRRALVNYATLPVATFLAMTLAWFCPWSVFLPAAVWRCRPRKLAGGSREERGALLVLLWAGSVVGFFALSASRLEYYTLPALPAFALCVGRLWDLECSAAAAGARSRGLAATWAALIAFAACLAPAAALFPRLERMRFYNLFPSADLPAGAPGAARPAAALVYSAPDFSRLVPVLEIVAALVIAGAATAAWAWARRRPRLSLACLVAAMAVGLAAVERGLLLFEPYGSVARLAGIVRSQARPGEPVVVEGRYERHAGLGFYTGRPVRIVDGDRGVLVYGSRFACPQGTFLSEEAFGRLWRGPERAFLLSGRAGRLAELRALDRGTVVLGRTGDTWLFANRRPGGPAR